MIQLDLQSERFGATGGVGAEGARRSLGRPAMEPLMLAVREMLQNSWDARLLNDAPVRVLFDVREISRQQRQALIDVCFMEDPRCVNVRDFIAKRAVVLGIRDENTVGLAGPTRADDAEEGDGERNFVEFFRNIGRSEDDQAGGGTYGFGKAALYMLSEAKTILAYSRCKKDKSYESRLMAAALGQRFDVKVRGRVERYTGRHWWGRRASDGVVDPLVGREADQVAALLGIEPFEKSETGTHILVIAPRLPQESLKQTAQYVHQCATWYVWPKLMASGNKRPTMLLTVRHDGSELDAASEALPMLNDWASLVSQHEQEGIPIEIHRPKRRLGTLYLKHVYPTASQPVDLGIDIDAGAFLPSPPFRHVALYRTPKLVVRYLLGPPLPTDGVGYIGVFEADPSLNGVFADAEPATHDEWNYETLAGDSKSFVKVALRRISERINEFAAPPSQDVAAGVQMPLGGLSSWLGGLVAESTGSGAEVPGEDDDLPRKKGLGQTRGGRASISIDPNYRLEVIDGHVCAVVSFTIAARKGTSQTTVEAIPKVLVLEGATETEPPEGAESAALIGWMSAAGVRKATSTLSVAADDGSVWSALIRMPKNSQVDPGLRIADGN